MAPPALNASGPTTRTDAAPPPSPDGSASLGTSDAVLTRNAHASLSPTVPKPRATTHCLRMRSASTSSPWSAIAATANTAVSLPSIRLSAAVIGTALPAPSAPCWIATTRSGRLPGPLNRYPERRARGGKGASACRVLRGPARRLAAAAPRPRAFAVAELACADRGRRDELRRPLEARRQRRVQRRRFRRDPQAYLQVLEEQLLQSTLPS